MANIFNRLDNGSYRKIAVNEYSDDSSDEGDDFIQRSIRDQQQQLQQQDEGLEMLSESAQRLGAMSMNIHQELGFQNKMIDEIEGDLGRAADNLDLLTMKTKEMIQKAGGKQTFCLIVGMVAVVIVLLFLIIFTF